MSPPFGVNVRAGPSISPLPLSPSWYGADLVKHQDDFTFFSPVACVCYVTENNHNFFINYFKLYVN